MPLISGIAPTIPKELRTEPRPVAVAIPYALDAKAKALVMARATHNPQIEEPLICLVTSRKRSPTKGLYVLPKGGIENGEDGREAAVRELYEEAGLFAAEVDPALVPAPAHSNTTLDHKPHKRSPTDDAQSPLFISRAMYSAFEIPVDYATGQAASWPEQHERERVWKPITEAASLIAWRPDIHNLLRASSLGQMYLTHNATLG